MSLPQTSGARALHDRKLAVFENAGIRKRAWATELVGDRTGKVLDPIIESLDTETAVSQAPNLFMELRELFCIRRDHRYGSRSRKWLMNRARHQRVQRDYRLWLAFVRENVDNGSIDVLLGSDTLELESLGYDEQIS